MKKYNAFKKSALATAVIYGAISLAAFAEEVDVSGNENIVGTFALGTQAQSEAEAQEQGKNADDLKLSPRLFRLKEYVKQEKEAQGTRANRSKRAVSNASDLNLDITFDGSLDGVRDELSAVGFNISAVYGNNIGGSISPENVEALSQISAVKRINVPEFRTRAGLVQNQADFVLYSKKIKESLKNAPTGKGVTVGIISDSFDCVGVRGNQGSAKDDVNNGELPADVNIVKEFTGCLRGGNDEGRGMAQLVHDIAPDAKIAFYSPQSLTDFAQAIQTLALPKGQFDAAGLEGAGADIIVDDLGYFTEPFYEIGIVGESITSVVKKGVAYFTAAGNDHLTDSSGTRDETVYSTNNAQFVPYTPGTNSPARINNAQVLKIREGSNSTILPVKVDDIPDSQIVGIWWNQSYVKGNKSKIMACLTRPDGTAIDKYSWCETQPLSQEPAMLVQFKLPKGIRGGNYGLQIFLLDGVKPTAFTVLGFGSVAIDASFAGRTGEIYGHAAAPAAFTLGAADFANTPECNAALTQAKVESFSSRGNSPHLFDSQGNAINTVPDKPDAVSLDGVSTSFFGRRDFSAGLQTFKDPACNLTSTYRFYGTSAAAPNAAAVAALIKQDNPGITPEKLYESLRKGATAVGKAPASGSYNYVAGYGVLNAEKTIEALRAAR